MHWQATLNASLNAASALLVALGFLAIRRRLVTLHKACMLLAVGVSAAFLASYLHYHYTVGATHFKGPEVARFIYLAILLTHTVLAVVAAPLVLITTYLGLRDRLVRHVRLAWWTLPIWLYVSITGVVIYVMLYHLFPPPPDAL